MKHLLTLLLFISTSVMGEKNISKDLVIHYLIDGQFSGPPDERQLVITSETKNTFEVVHDIFISGVRPSNENI